MQRGKELKSKTAPATVIGMDVNVNGNVAGTPSEHTDIYMYVFIYTYINVYIYVCCKNCKHCFRFIVGIWCLVQSNCHCALQQADNDEDEDDDALMPQQLRS